MSLEVLAVMSFKESKKKIREEILRQRGAFYKEGSSEASDTIIKRLMDEPAYQHAAIIFCFVSFGTEVHTHDFIKQALLEGKRIFVPYVPKKSEGMKACEIKDFSELELGYFNILTPKEEFRRITEEQPDMIVMPGVAFSRDGYRVGYGGGFYDRYLSSLTKPVDLIGIGFHLQVVDEVPVEAFDQPIHQLITEKEILYFRA